MVYGSSGYYRRRRRLSCGCIGVCDGSCGPSLIEEVVGIELEVEGLRDGDVGELLLGEEIAQGGGRFGGLIVAEELLDRRDDDRRDDPDQGDYRDDPDQGDYPGGGDGGDISWP